jgi:hypothetical protein
MAAIGRKARPKVLATVGCKPVVPPLREAAFLALPVWGILQFKSFAG